jgi:hypothetical protein
LSRISGEDDSYGFKDSIDLRKASFIFDESDWPHWKNSVPIERDGNVSETSYLSNKHVGDEEWQFDYSKNRISLITAIVTRFIAIYENWYREMRIGDLHQ